MRNEILAAAISVGALVGCSDAAPAPVPVDVATEATTDTQLTDQNCIQDYFDQGLQVEQQAYLASQIENTAHLTQQVDLPEANQVLEFLVSETIRVQMSVDKVELIAIDRTRNYGCRIFDEPRQLDVYGFFNRDVDAMVLIKDGEQENSNFWRTLVLIHEGKHGWNLHNGYSGTTEERDTRVFEQTIMSAWGGDQYRNLLNELKQEIVDSGFSEQGRWMIYPPEIPPEVDEIFGPTTGSADRGIRDASITVHAVFELIADSAAGQGFSPTDVPRLQETYVQGMQQNAGVSPSGN